MDEGYLALAIGQRNAVLIKTPFINAKRLSGGRAQRYCGTRQTKRRSPFTVFPTVRRYNGNGNFSMTPTVRARAHTHSHSLTRCLSLSSCTILVACWSMGTDRGDTLSSFSKHRAAVCLTPAVESLERE